MSSDAASSLARERHRTCANALLRLSQERHRQDVLRALQANRRLQSRMRQVPILPGAVDAYCDVHPSSELCCPGRRLLYRQLLAHTFVRALGL